MLRLYFIIVTHYLDGFYLDYRWIPLLIFFILIKKFELILGT